MNINSIYIKNFRGIGNECIKCEFDNFNIFIGNNGTCKTAIIEALNLCLSSSYAASKLSLEDFHRGGNESIQIKVCFKEPFDVEIPDLHGNKQIIKCNAIALVARKRERAAPGKAFNDMVVVDHFYVPIEKKQQDGWTITRKNASELKITERQLALSYASADYPKSFYFGKNRERQLQKGYNSSFSNIVSDLNWRFEKGERAKEESECFKNLREQVEKYITDNTDGDTLKKTVLKTNEKLKTLDLPEIDICLLKTLTPYDNSELVKRFDRFELPVSLTGSGIEMLTALIFLETLAQVSKDEICIIVDEPELHLHPILQDKFAKHLQDISKETQVFVSTHSPFFFKNSYINDNTKILITEADSGEIKITDAKERGFGLLSWSPSWGEICYLAYDLPTIEFHDDLYAAIQDKNKTETIAATESWFINQGQTKEIIWYDEKGNKTEETLMTYIRNRIHHADNQCRPLYTPEQLKDSIERMVVLLK